MVPRISKTEVTQVINLRFFLQVFSLSERDLENSFSKRVRTAAEQAEEKRARDHLPLLEAFAQDT